MTMIKKAFCKTWDLMCSHGLLLGGGATGVLALFTLFKSSFSLDGWQAFGLIIGLYFIILLCVFGVNFIQIKYGKGVDKVNAPDVIGIQVLLNFEKDTQKVIAGKLHIDKALQRLCDGVKSYFDILCQCECFVSIKVNVSQENSQTLEDVKVTNVCRDRLSADSRDIKKYSMIDHFIVKNTAFLSVVNKVNEGKSDVYYINEKISETSDYHTTSLDVYPNNTLPYEAECVYPIMSLYEPPGEAWDMKGFLCVDSKTECAFRKDNIAMICFMKLVCNGLNRII